MTSVSSPSCEVKGEIETKPEAASSSIDSVVDDTEFRADDTGTECLQCRQEYHECVSFEVKLEPKDTEEPSFFELVNSFSADIDAFSESVDDLENISESVRSLVRNLRSGDGRPAGAWKDIC